MSNVRKILICLGANVRKQLANPRIYTILAIVVMFHYYSFACVTKVCEYLNIAVTPWVFPFFLGNPNYFFIYGGLAMLLYCDAPFMGTETPFLLIRLGRKRWIWGQLLYIYLSAFVYTIINVLTSLLMIFPQMVFSGEWGDLLWILAQNGEVFRMAGTTAGFGPVLGIMEQFTPIQAMGMSILLFYLGTVFLGMVILCCRLCFCNMSGIVVCGVLTSVAYFTPYLGLLNYGFAIYYFSPVTWSCLSYLNTGEGPAPKYAIVVYLLSIMIMSLISVVVFCKKDVSWEEI